MRRVAIGVGLVLTGVAVTLFLLFSQTEVARALRHGSPVCVLVVGTDGSAAGPGVNTIGVLILHPGGKATWISVPQTLVWPTASGWASLHSLYPTEGWAGVTRRLSLLLEISIPYRLEVDVASVGSVVDAVGGVELTVSERLIHQDRVRNLFVDIPAGRQILDGTGAVDFLRHRDDERGRLAREHQFIEALLESTRVLTVGRLRGSVELLYQKAQTNLSLWETLDLARGMVEIPADRVAFASVPTVPRVGVAGQEVPDIVRLRQLTLAALKGQVHLTRDGVRVLILNGTGQRLLATRTGAWLSQLGFAVAGMADADRSNYPRTLIVVREEARTMGRSLFDVIPPRVQAEVRIQTDREFDLARVGGWPQDTDVILIVGAGFDVWP